MTKKHFIELAEWIKSFNANEECHRGQPFTERQIEMLSEFCKNQNGNFNKSLWLSYIKGECGVNGGKK
jgi:hypothetical protein